MEFTHRLKLGLQLRHDHLGYGYSPVLVAFAVHRENAVSEVEILNSQLYELEETKPAAIQQLDHDIEGIFKVLGNRIYFRPGENHGNIFRFLCAGHIPLIAEVLLEDMPEKKQQGIEGLILGRGGNTAFHGKIR